MKGIFAIPGAIGSTGLNTNYGRGSLMSRRQYWITAFEKCLKYT